MPELLTVALASSAGATARFGLGRWILARGLEHWPMTLGINLAGCLLAGFMAASGRLLLPGVEAALTAGFLGGFTTVSTFSLEVLGLWRSTRPVQALAYVLASMMGSLLCVLVGWQVGSGLWAQA